jgi:hypothetical protein
MSQESYQRSLACLLLLALMLVGQPRLLAQEAAPTIDTVGRGVSSSIALDATGNLHMTYLGPNAKVYYAFRPAGSKKWFSISVVESTHAVKNIYPMIAVDSGGQPHICVSTGELQYITLLNGKWSTQIVDQGGGVLSYHCSIAISPDGIPHLSWYHEFLPSGQQFTHLRHAEMEQGVWMARSVDGGISGKWNSMALDAKGFPHISFSQFGYGGDLRYAVWNGKEWTISDVDSSHNSSTARGFDNSLALGADGSEHISYFDANKLKYAHRSAGKWIIETVATAAPDYDHYAGSTTMLLDKQGSPHIVYGDFGSVVHAFRQGDKWQTENIVRGGIQQYPSVSAAIGADDTLYVSYPDPADGNVKLATVTLGSVPANSAPEASPPKQQPE